MAKPALFSSLFGQKEIKPVIAEEKIATAPVVINQPAAVETAEPAKPKLFSFTNIADFE